MLLRYFVLIFFSSTLAAETYREYVKRIDSIKYTTQGGESINGVLQKTGYRKLNGQFGDINQTRWKNGLDNKNIEALPAGTELRLPYKGIIEVPKPVAVMAQKKRSIASLEISETKEGPREDLGAVSLGYTESFLSLQSTDDSGRDAKLESKSSRKVGLAFFQFWNHLNIITSYRLSQHSVELDTPATKTLSKSKFNLSNFGFGVDKKTANGWVFGGAIDYNTVIYAADSTADNIKVQGSQLGELSARVSKQLAEYKKLKFKAELKGLAIIPRNASDTKFKSGWGAEPSLQSSYRHKNWALSADMFYKFREIKRDVSTDKQTEVGITFGFTYYWD